MHSILRLAIVGGFVVAVAADVGWSQEPAGSGGPAEIGRAIAGKGQSIAFPKNKKSVKHQIEKDGPLYPFPDGESRAALFKLAGYEAPYTLTVRSLCKCLGFSKKLFLPRGVFLDANFQETGTLAESQFVIKEGGMKPFHVAATVPIGAERARDAYLILFTDARYIGRRVGTVDSDNGQVKISNYPVSRGPEGTIELEAGPATR